MVCRAGQTQTVAARRVFASNRRHFPRDEFRILLRRTFLGDVFNAHQTVDAKPRYAPPLKHDAVVGQYDLADPFIPGSCRILTTNL